MKTTRGALSLLSDEQLKKAYDKVVAECRVHPVPVNRPPVSIETKKLSRKHTLLLGEFAERELADPTFQYPKTWDFHTDHAPTVWYNVGFRECAALRRVTAS